MFIYSPFAILSWTMSIGTLVNVSLGDNTSSIKIFHFISLNGLLIVVIL